MSAMKEALKNRHMKGLDISIILGGAEPINSPKMEDKQAKDEMEKEGQGSDLAPERKEGDAHPAMSMLDNAGTDRDQGGVMSQDEDDEDQDAKIREALSSYGGGGLSSRVAKGVAQKGSKPYHKA